MNQLHRWTSGFSTMELALALSAMTIAAGVIAPRVQDHMSDLRDVRRISDIAHIQDAIESYHADRGAWPAATSNPACGGWDVSHDESFLDELVEGGYMPDRLDDPLNDGEHHYRYFVYPEGSYGHAGGSPFYVLAIRHFETEEARLAHPGGFAAKVRDWGREYDYVTGSD